MKGKNMAPHERYDWQDEPWRTDQRRFDRKIEKVRRAYSDVSDTELEAMLLEVDNDTPG